MNEIRGILSRKPFHVWDFDADANFTLGPKALASNDLVLREKGWTLFDLNFKNGMAIFLNVPTEAELAKAPFAYLRCARADRNGLCSNTRGIRPGHIGSHSLGRPPTQSDGPRTGGRVHPGLQ